MNKDRRNELIKAAATALAQGSVPFSDWWLIKYDVTSDECLDVADIIATILNWFVKQPQDKEIQIFVSEALDS